MVKFTCPEEFNDWFFHNESELNMFKNEYDKSIGKWYLNKPHAHSTPKLFFDNAQSVEEFSKISQKDTILPWTRIDGFIADIRLDDTEYSSTDENFKPDEIYIVSTNWRTRESTWRVIYIPELIYYQGNPTNKQGWYRDVVFHEFNWIEGYIQYNEPSKLYLTFNYPGGL